MLAMHNALKLGYCNRHRIEVLEKLEGKTQFNKKTAEKAKLCLV